MNESFKKDYVLHYKKENVLQTCVQSDVVIFLIEVPSSRTTLACIMLIKTLHHTASEHQSLDFLSGVVMTTDNLSLIPL